MMRPLGILVFVLLSCATAFAAAEAQPNCGQTFRVEQRSFQELPDPAKYAAVWVDNIPSTLLGGFRPFEIYVVVGNLFSPFQAKRGKLEREDFLRLNLNPDAARIGPLRVTTPGDQLAFPNNNRPFTLHVDAVKSKLIGEDSVTLRLCWRSP